MTGFGDLNLKNPSILANSVFMSIINFMLSLVEHEKSSLTSGPGVWLACVAAQADLCLAW